MLPTYAATRYVVPLREGGSLPAVIETDTGGLFVVKFRGAGQGAKALIAEILFAELARALGLPVPDAALIELDESFGRSEPDPEIQDILRGSRGLNFGLRYLEGAFNFDPRADSVAAELAAEIVWLDALVSNIDRTHKNPNLMWHEKGLRLIDHGAAFYFHHDWPSTDEERARRPFEPIADHVLIGAASSVEAVDERLAARLDDDALAEVLGSVPDALLMDAPTGATPAFATAEENRDAYRRYLAARLEPPRPFVEATERARTEHRSLPVTRKDYRR